MVDWAAITAVGTVLAGLALPLAFVQLDAQRRERLRAQVGKVGAWTRISAEFADGESRPATQRTIDGPQPVSWKVNLVVRNSSELPVVIHGVDLHVTPQGLNFFSPEEEARGNGLISSGDIISLSTFNGVIIEPESIHEREALDLRASDFPSDRPWPPKTSVDLILVTDAAGQFWQMRPTKGRPPRRVFRWSRKRLLLL